MQIYPANFLNWKWKLKNKCKARVCCTEAGDTLNEKSSTILSPIRPLQWSGWHSLICSLVAIDCPNASHCKCLVSIQLVYRSWSSWISCRATIERKSCSNQRQRAVTWCFYTVPFTAPVSVRISSIFSFFLIVQHKAGREARTDRCIMLTALHICFSASGMFGHDHHNVKSRVYGVATVKASLQMAGVWSCVADEWSTVCIWRHILLNNWLNGPDVWSHTFLAKTWLFCGGWPALSYC